MSVVSIDDHEMAPVLDLTTVAQNVEGQGQAAARMLLQLLGGEVGTPPQERMVLPTNLVLRGTTAPPS
jgi:LacI family transcriptional regulator, repressor for deo operon, udp, cdd, tsx, nupC, and nupG